MLNLVSFTPSFEKEQDLLLYKEASSLLAELRRAHFEAYFAGGAVRDMLLKRPLKDIDIATNGSIEELKKLFPKAILVGAQFGVLRVLRKGYEFEIATFRTESDYQDGRHPSHVAKASSYEEDAARRDFTINGLFFDPEKNLILDCVGGISDIEKKSLRTIGSPHERFREDKLRVLRAIRFSHALHFPIQNETKEAMREFAPFVREAVSGERIWDELSKMSCLNILPEALETIWEIGLFPELQPARIARLKEIPPSSLPVQLAFLLYDAPDLSLWAKEHFHVSGKESTLMEQYQMLYRGFSQKSPLEPELVSLLALSYVEEILPSLAFLVSKTPQDWLREMERKRKELAPWIEQRRTKKYLVSGADLLSKNMVPGKNIGALMEKAFLLSLERRLLDKDALLRELFSL